MRIVENHTKSTAEEYGGDTIFSNDDYKYIEDDTPIRQKNNTKERYTPTISKASSEQNKKNVQNFNVPNRKAKSKVSEYKEFL